MFAEDRLRAATERMELTRAFGERVRDLRRAAGLSATQLADNCRLSPSTISKVELARGEPRLSLILTLCQGLGLSPNSLLSGLPVPQARRR
jgi:transcriptional regulator with XRE-family HTH domain